MQEHEKLPTPSPRKWTTKVNIAIVVAVLVVFSVGMIWLWVVR